jgi:2,3-bisphosphoglycerate-dependent phosphoglycerate mutase
MKNFFLLFVFTFTLLISCTADETTTYYLIRHSEKDRTNPRDRNPNLNIEGEKRAQSWAEYFKDTQIDAVYSTNYNRTIQTPTPTAFSNNLKVAIYNPNNMYDSVFQKKTKGKSVLVVGHSNTTPVFANKILDEDKYVNMADDDNATLFIITIKGDEISSETKKVN